MLNQSASLAMLTSVLEALPGKLDIKRHSPSILSRERITKALVSLAEAQSGMRLSCFHATKPGFFASRTI